MNTHVRDAAMEIWTERIARWQAEFQRITGASAEETVHDFRVASRRLRVALLLFSPVYRNQACLNSLRDALRNAARILGPARDLTIHVGLVQTLTSELGLTDTLQVWLNEWRERKRLAFESLGVRLSEHWRLSERLTAFIQFPDFVSGEDLLEPYLALHVRRHAEPLLSETNVESEVGDVQKMHRLRILTKRFRYVLESTEAYLPQKQKRLIKHAKKMQDILGHMHDRDVLVMEIQKDMSRLTDSRRWTRTIRIPRNDLDAASITTEIRLLQNPDVAKGVLNVYSEIIRHRQELSRELAATWSPVIEKISKAV